MQTPAVLAGRVDDLFIRAAGCVCHNTRPAFSQDCADGDDDYCCVVFACVSMVVFRDECGQVVVDIEWLVLEYSLNRLGPAIRKAWASERTRAFTQGRSQENIWGFYFGEFLIDFEVTFMNFMLLRQECINLGS